MDCSTSPSDRSPVPRSCSNSCPSSPWCYKTISSFVLPCSSCLQSFPASGSFLMSRLFASGGQSIGGSESASVLRKNIYSWFPLGSPCSPRYSQESSPTLQFKSINYSALSFLYSLTITGLFGSACSSRDTQESSPIPQFKNINSLMLSFLYSPSLKSVF